jgi:hypothetical protein
MKPIMAAREFLAGLLVLAELLGLGKAHADVSLPASFSGRWNLVGRTALQTNDASISIRGGYACDGGKWSDAEVSFRARAPVDVGQVQIWAGLRCLNRDERYVFALRGGADNDVYLARYGPDGEAKFLGFAPLDFSPQPGQWYRLRAVAMGKRLQIFLNDETDPRLNVVDAEAAWTNGSACLGGGWLETEFADFSVHPLTSAEKTAFIERGDRCRVPPIVDKEAKRREQRAAYRPVSVSTFKPLRTEVALDGNWLFLPDYQVTPTTKPERMDADDRTWHVMPVPQFWTPGLSWLHGETGFPELKGVASTKGVADSLTVLENRRVENYTFDWRKTKGAWYRQHLELPPDVAGRHFILTFDAIAKVSEIWVNGIKVGSHTGLFGQGEYDVTEAMRPGENLIAVRVLSQLDREQTAGKVEGVAETVEVTSKMLHSLPHGMLQDDVGGIWQPVRLTVTAPVYLRDAFVEPTLRDATIHLNIQNGRREADPISVDYIICETGNNAVLYRSGKQDVGKVPAGGEKSIRFKTPSLEPKLWSPQHPNLYQLVARVWEGGNIVDEYSVRFGFRTFRVQGSQLILNGKPYWLRGGNPFPNTLRPNDAALAGQFMDIAKAGNVAVTRSHIVPFTRTWLDAADEKGMGVSFEGTWPWLMLKGEPPEANLIREWKAEFLSLMREHRNHPSLLFWTVNNEMKFESADATNQALLRKKWVILDDAIKAMRAADPTRPIVADSSYVRKEAIKGYRSVVKPLHLDDGDIDDGHRYYGWYNETFYHFFDGQYGKDYATRGRPFISQEMATGYPNSDDGHPTRFYLFKHQTPQAFVGEDAWEYADPGIFLKRQNFLTKELAETFRRANRKEMAGILHFAYFTWFGKPWTTNEMQTWPAAEGLKVALQPVLVSAELFGRHFYAGHRVRARVCVANDSEDCAPVRDSRLTWQIIVDGTVLREGHERIGDVGYYRNRWRTVEFTMPEKLPRPRVDAQLRLRLESGASVISENSYEVLLATENWAKGSNSCRSPVRVIYNVTARQIPELRTYIRNGGRAMLIHPGPLLTQLYPKKVKGYTAKEGEIVTMHIPESPIFDGIQPLDLAWFDRGRKVPIACTGVYHVANGAGGIVPVAWHYDIHGYLQKPSDIEKIRSTPMVEIHDGKGLLLASEICYEAGTEDPVAMRLLNNAIQYLQRN